MVCFLGSYLLVTGALSRPPIDRRAFVGAAAGAAAATACPPKVALARSIERLPGPTGGVLPLTIGLGTCLVSDGLVKQTAGLGIEAGYRVFDTAQRYGNEKGLGSALKSSFAEGKLRREDAFVTTKVWVDNMGSGSTLASVRRSADLLDLGAIDLCLIHWPGQFQRRGGEYDAINARLRRETWSDLEAAQRVRSRKEHRREQLLGAPPEGAAQLRADKARGQPV